MPFSAALARTRLTDEANRALEGTSSFPVRDLLYCLRDELVPTVDDQGTAVAVFQVVELAAQLGLLLTMSPAEYPGRMKSVGTARGQAMLTYRMLTEGLEELRRRDPGRTGPPALDVPPVAQAIDLLPAIHLALRTGK